ncbi:MAG: hypothetical protein ACRC9P_05400, partial [Bacteroides sp.]
MLIRDKLMERAIEDDVGLIQKQSERYTQAIYDKELKTLQMDFSLQLMDLDASAGSFYYQTALGNVGGSLGVLFASDRINTEDKVKMATQVLSNMAYSGHVEGARNLRDMPIIETQDGYVPLRVFLSPDEDLKLQKGIEAGFTKNKEMMRVGTLLEHDNLVRELQSDPQKAIEFDGSAYDRILLENVNNGNITGEKFISMRHDIDKAQGTSANSAQLINMYLKGDVKGIMQLGETLPTAGKQFFQSLAGMPMEEQMQYMNMALQNGNSHVLGLISSTAEPVIERLRNGADLSQDDVSTLNFLTSMYNTGAYNSSPAQTLNGMLQGMDNANALFFRGVLKSYQPPMDNT